MPKKQGNAQTILKQMLVISCAKKQRNAQTIAQIIIVKRTPEQAWGGSHLGQFEHQIK